MVTRRGLTHQRTAAPPGSPALVALVVLLTLAPAGCSDGPPTSVLLGIRAAGAVPALDELRLSVFVLEGVVITGQRLPAQGAPSLPDEVVLYPPAAAGTLRVLVRGLSAGAAVGEGVTLVQVIAGQQVRADVLLQAGRLPDSDGDGVPDAVDNCKDLPNPAQGPCSSGDGGPPDRGPDAPRDGEPPDGPRPDQGPPADKGPVLDQSLPPPDQSPPLPDQSLPPPDTLPPCALAGGYTIDPAGIGSKNFTTFAAALAKLKACGVSADVTFTVASGIYQENGFSFPAVPGASASKQITFKSPNPTSSPSVELRGSAGAYVIRIEGGAGYLTLDGFEIDGAVAANKISTSYAGPVLFQQGTVGQHHITLRRLYIHDFGPTAWGTYTYIGGVYLQLSSTVTVEQITFDRCRFEHLQPPSSFHTQGAISLRYGDRKGLRITRCRFIDIQLMDAVNLRGGSFTDLLIANNFFVLPSGYGAVDLYSGPTLTGSNNLMVFNTLLLGGTGNSAPGYGVNGSATGQLVVHSNVARGLLGTGAQTPAFISSTAGGSTNVQGHNCLYLVTAGYTATSTDVLANPLLKSVAPTYDLHLQSGSPCAGSGKPTGAVSDDIDGDSRGASPEIGADELTP